MSIKCAKLKDLICSNGYPNVLAPIPSNMENIHLRELYMNFSRLFPDIIAVSVNGVYDCEVDGGGDLSLSVIDIDNTILKWVLDQLENHAHRTLYVFLDLGYLLESGADKSHQRTVKEILSVAYRCTCKTLWLESGMEPKIAPSLDKLIKIEHGLFYSEPVEVLDNLIQDAVMDNELSIAKADEPVLEALREAVRGINTQEVLDIWKQVYHTVPKPDLRGILALVQERKTAYYTQQGLEFVNPPDIKLGGMVSLKKWLVRRRGLFLGTIPELNNLPRPKGFVLVGVPGTGKSEVCKLVGKTFNCPVIRFDPATIFNSLVGESEKAIKRTLKLVEMTAPCILWIDEIEKVFATSGLNDSGISSRVLGTLLTWMSDRNTDPNSPPIFVAATANSIENLPPELTRKGRFDEVFFIDLPDENSTLEILETVLARYNKNINQKDLKLTLDRLSGYTGAEIKAVVEEAIILAYELSEELSPKHIIQSASEIIPLSQAKAEQIDELRDWAKSHARVIC